MEKYIDLHTHTKLSDGAFAPSELVAKAAEIGLSAIALTDHDLIDGLDEALVAGRERAIEVIPGVELTAYEGEKEFHIVGLFIDFHDSALQTKLKAIQEARVNRAHLIVENLNKLGYAVTFDEVRALAAGTIGKPHLAMATIQNPVNKAKLFADFGEEPTSGQFIVKYLNADSPAYVKKEVSYTPAEAIAEIKRVGGVSSVAHPGWGMADVSEAGHVEFHDQDLEWLQSLGLDAVEVYASYEGEDLTKTFFNHFNKRADELGLLKTGGSDYHGFGSAGKQLGFKDFYLKVPYELVVALKKRAQK